MRDIPDHTVAVTVLGSPAKLLSSLRRITDWADDLYLAYAWASSEQGRADHWRALPIEKIRKAIIGVHFTQTEPWILETLARGPGILKVVEDTAGVYHPKVLIGTKGRDAVILIGSSNFTSGGFAGNTEINVLLEGPRESTALSGIIGFVEAQWRGPNSFEPDADWLSLYQDAHARRPPPPCIPRPVGKTVIISREQDLDVSWSEYYALIKAQEGRTLANGTQIHVFEHPNGSYLEEAEECRRAFAQHATFAAMPPVVRRLVASSGKESSGYFGRNVVAGNFVKLVWGSPRVLGEFLDAIPLTGDISREQVESYLAGMVAIHGINIGTATRLLSVKRQDRFVPLNNANHRRICELFGDIRYTVQGYLRLYDRIGGFEWMRAPEPLYHVERRVWHARTALLDSLLYEAPSAESAPQGFPPR